MEKRVKKETKMPKSKEKKTAKKVCKEEDGIVDVTINVLPVLEVPVYIHNVPTDKIYVFVSGPYTKGDVGANVAEAVACADYLLRKRFVPFVPHIAHFWHMMHQHDYEDWMKWDIAWLHKCNALLRIPGDSKGADREVNFAIELGIPVYYDMDELLSDFEEYV